MKKIILIGGAVIVLLGGAGAGVYFFMPDLLPEVIRPKDDPKSKAAKKQEEEKKKHEPEVAVDLEVFVVNLAGANPRYLRTTLSLGVKDEHEKEKIKEFNGKIRHAVIMYLTERKAEELMDPEGKSKVRADLHKLIGEAAGDPKLVTNVYFKEFLIQ